MSTPGDDNQRVESAAAPLPAEQAQRRDEGDAEPVLETPLRDAHPIVWFITLILPVALTVVVLGFIWLLRGGPFLMRTLGMAASTCILGRFVILSPAKVGLSPYELALMVFYMDVMTAIFLSCHMWILYRIPWFGGKIQDLVNDGHLILGAHPWMKRATFVGIVAFVALPLAYTGSVGGSIFSRLLGMSRLAAAVGVSLGSLIGCGAMLVFSVPMRRYFDPDNPLTTIGGFVLILVIIVVLNNRYRKFKEEHENRRKAAQKLSREQREQV